MAPFPVPNIKYPDRVCMPDEGLKFTAINPCSFVQFDHCLSFFAGRFQHYCRIGLPGHWESRVQPDCFCVPSAVGASSRSLDFIPFWTAGAGMAFLPHFGGGRLDFKRSVLKENHEDGR